MKKRGENKIKDDRNLIRFFFYPVILISTVYMFLTDPLLQPKNAAMSLFNVIGAAIIMIIMIGIVELLMFLLVILFKRIGLLTNQEKLTLTSRQKEYKTQIRRLVIFSLVLSVILEPLIFFVNAKRGTYYNWWNGIIDLWGLISIYGLYTLRTWGLQLYVLSFFVTLAVTLILQFRSVGESISIVLLCAPLYYLLINYVYRRKEVLH